MSQKWEERHAAVTALGQMAGGALLLATSVADLFGAGCGDALFETMPQWIKCGCGAYLRKAQQRCSLGRVLCQLAEKDPHPRVQYAALMTLTLWADDFRVRVSCGCFVTLC